MTLKLLGFISDRTFLTQLSGGRYFRSLRYHWRISPKVYHPKITNEVHLPKYTIRRLPSKYTFRSMPSEVHLPNYTARSIPSEVIPPEVYLPKKTFRRITPKVYLPKYTFRSMPSKVYLPIHRLMSIIRTVSPHEVCCPKYITPSIQPQVYRPKYIALKYTVTLFTVPHFSVWSFDASETGESTKYPWVGVVEDTHLHLDAINPIASTHGHLYSAQFCSHPETLMAACRTQRSAFTI